MGVFSKICIHYLWSLLLSLLDIWIFAALSPSDDCHSFWTNYSSIVWWWLLFAFFLVQSNLTFISASSNNLFEEISFAFVTLDHQQQRQFLYEKVIEISDLVDKQLRIYRNKRSGSLRMSDLRSILLSTSNQLLLDVVYLFVFQLTPKSYREKIPWDSENHRKGIWKFVNDKHN